MASHVRVSACLAALAATVVLWFSAARAETPVDLQLVLTVDVSLSMDLDEQRLQRDGYVSAFRDPQVWDAIRGAGAGRIAVAYVEWAGPSMQSLVMPWTLIDTQAAAQAFADTLGAKPISRARLTSISGALRYAERQLAESPFAGRRKVIDVSGDGPNNSGPPIVPVRDALVAQGIVINGLPILLKQGGWNSAFDLRNLDSYYAECVIGGPGSFSIPVRDKAEFAAAIRRKLVLEIAGRMPQDRVRRAGGESRKLWRAQMLPGQVVPDHRSGEPADCMVGERLWQRYMDGPYFRE